MSVANRRMLCELIRGRLKSQSGHLVRVLNIFVTIRCLLIDPEITKPSSALMTTAVTACSCPVRVALGVGTSPSPTMLWVRAFQCHNSTVQSAEPDAI